MVAEIIINSIVKVLNRVFDYNIPEELADKIKIGSRVLVPFGNGKKLEDGFVINIKQSSEYKIKDIVKGLMICTFISGFLIGILSVLILILFNRFKR